ncbi:MAG: dihydrofolate reductase family protein [Methylococcaceae bacterium]
MHEELVTLYPPPHEIINLQGTYLAHRLHTLGCSTTPFVYANFLSTLDGRIALKDSGQNTIPYIPKHITTASDFRLFLELHAQADCLITHGGYMRALHEKRLGNILQVNHNDLVAYRQSQGLKPQPAVIIASASLDFPMHLSLQEHGQDIYIATGKNVDADRMRYWQDQGYKLLLAGEECMVQGAALIDQISKLGYQSIYLVAGPQMLDTMIREKQLHRLYLTMTHQLIGGLDFRTVLTGPPLIEECNMTLKSLYFEQDSPSGPGQFFMQYDL